MQFADYDQLTSHLVERVSGVISHIPALSIKEGYSNQSCSAYVNVTFWELDEDGDKFDCFGDCKVRFSDHGDRYGSDLSIRFDGLLDSDELGDVSLADWRIEEIVQEAVVFIKAEFEAQK